MKSSLGLINSMSFGGFLLGTFATVASGGAGTFRWLPKTASDNVVCLPGEGDCGETEIRLSGGDVTVTLFLEMANWDPDGDGHPTLGGFQGGLEAETYEGGLAIDAAYPGHPGNPGTVAGCDLESYGWSLDPDLRDCAAGAFMALKVCVETLQFPDVFDPLSTCTPATAEADCGPFPAGCVDRPDWVFAGISYTPTISCAQEDYTIGAASTDCREDDGEYPFYYGGTLVVSVPACAIGTYNVGFIDDVNFTILNDCTGVLIPETTKTPAQITITAGRCCYGIGTASTGCLFGVSEAECNLEPAPRLYEIGPPCSEPCPECLTGDQCADPTPAQDPSADNLCTVDSCTDGTCVHTPDYDDQVYCCDPDLGPVGGLTVIDDGEECSVDTCDPDTGIVTREGGDCDNDNVCDDVDNCPTVRNRLQVDGDGDGYGDRCDDPFDADHDGDVDLIDFSSFADCLGGPVIAASSDCQDIHDFNSDTYVDVHDMAELQMSFTGEVATPCD
ncbi:MAG: hypothetical protein JSU63_21280 [Phycisphaerales bacterium]|nr:MAG: hypothetical protein JSU63_21280 [Phycisphaerales bacterium]